MTLLNSQVMIGGGLAVILQEKRATDPSVTTIDFGWIVKGEIPTQEKMEQTVSLQQMQQTMRMSEPQKQSGMFGHRCLN